MKQAVVATMGAFTAFAGVAVGVEQGIEKLVGSFVDYADQVRNVQFVTGATAEESSRLIQMADDAKISYEDLAKAMQFASKQGVTPNVEGLAKLSDAYRKLMPGQERENFLLKEFGKNGGVMAELMNQGSGAILGNAAAIDKWLIMSQKELDRARDMQRAVDDLTDTWTGLKLEVGNLLTLPLSPLLQDWAIGFKGINEELQRTGDLNPAAIFVDMVRMNMEKHLKDIADAARDADGGFSEATIAAGKMALAFEGANTSTAGFLDNLTGHYDGYLRLIGTFASSEQSYAKSAKGLVEERIQLEQERATKIKEGYSAQGTVIQDLDKKLAENAKASEDNAAQHDVDTAKIVWDYQLQQFAADGLTAKETAFLEERAKQSGIWADAEIQNTINVIEQTQKYNDMLNAIPGHIYTTLELRTIYGDSARVIGAPRAAGGPVEAGRAYIVGEQRAEMFVPEQSGTILPSISAVRGASVPSVSTATGGGTTINNFSFNFPHYVGSRQELNTAMRELIRRMQMEGTA